MEVPEPIVVNRTHELGNYSCESSEDNVLVLARGDRTVGLTSSWAATRVERPNGIALSTVRSPHVNAVCGISGVPSLSRIGEGHASGQVSDKCTQRALRVEAAAQL